MKYLIGPFPFMAPAGTAQAQSAPAPVSGLAAAAHCNCSSQLGEVRTHKASTNNAAILHSSQTTPTFNASTNARLPAPTCSATTSGRLSSGSGLAHTAQDVIDLTTPQHNFSRPACAWGASNVHDLTVLRHSSTQACTQFVCTCSNQSLSPHQLAPPLHPSNTSQAQRGSSNQDHTPPLLHSQTSANPAMQGRHTAMPQSHMLQ